MHRGKIGSCALAVGICLAVGTEAGEAPTSVSLPTDSPQTKRALPLSTEPLNRRKNEPLPTHPGPSSHEPHDYRRVSGEMARGENLDQILRRAGVKPEESLAFARALKKAFDPRRARPADHYEITLDPDGHLHRFVYRRNPLEVYRAEAEAGDGQRTWKVERVQVPIERRETRLAGHISGSLYEAFMERGADADLTMAFVELFSWDIDFTRETREGDEFRVIYEKLFVGEDPAGNGRILAAQYTGTRGKRTAIYYKSERTEGYFDPEGGSVRKSFLRSPLSFTRISSRFSRARRHPVLKVVRPHNGVDYAAPTGTPVWSVAKGTVVVAGWKGEAGKTVGILHSNGYQTWYNHLSRFAKGIKKGVEVKQGQTIGYVGKTGLATGPHLDFRVKKEGRWVDPLRERYVAGDPVPADERRLYNEWAQAWVDRLKKLVGTVQVATEGAE